jgi:hypothetical protein
MSPSSARAATRADGRSAVASASACTGSGRGQRLTTQSTIERPLDWKKIERMTTASSSTTNVPTRVPPSSPTTTSDGIRLSQLSIA